MWPSPLLLGLWFSSFSLACTSLKNVLNCGPFAHYGPCFQDADVHDPSFKHPLQNGGSTPSPRASPSGEHRQHGE